MAASEVMEYLSFILMTMAMIAVAASLAVPDWMEYTVSEDVTTTFAISYYSRNRGLFKTCLSTDQGKRKLHFVILTS